VFPDDGPDDLRAKIEQYKRTRRTSAKSLQRWLDALIEDAERRLHELAQLPAEAAIAGSKTVTTTPTPPASHPARRTYPFDERAPRQRPGSRGM
jgi:hypothetical protein